MLLFGGLFEDLALVELPPFAVGASPRKVLLNQLLGLFRLGIEFFPLVDFIVCLPVGTQLRNQKQVRNYNRGRQDWTNSLWMPTLGPSTPKHQRWSCRCPIQTDTRMRRLAYAFCLISGTFLKWTRRIYKICLNKP